MAQLESLSGRSEPPLQPESGLRLPHQHQETRRTLARAISTRMSRSGSEHVIDTALHTDARLGLEWDQHGTGMHWNLTPSRGDCSRSTKLGRGDGGVGHAGLGRASAGVVAMMHQIITVLQRRFGISSARPVSSARLDAEEWRDPLSSFLRTSLAGPKLVTHSGARVAGSRSVAMWQRLRSPKALPLLNHVDMCGPEWWGVAYAGQMQRPPPGSAGAPALLPCPQALGRGRGQTSASAACNSPVVHLVYTCAPRDLTLSLASLRPLPSSGEGSFPTAIDRAAVIGAILRPCIEDNRRA
jgi:hypothetical protein